jgi:hypothetical protein
LELSQLSSSTTYARVTADVLLPREECKGRTI